MIVGGLAQAGASGEVIALAANAIAGLVVGLLYMAGGALWARPRCTSSGPGSRSPARPRRSSGSRPLSRDGGRRRWRPPRRRRRRDGPRAVPDVELDPVIHAQARLRVVATLARLARGDRIAFPRLQKLLDMTAGNLSTHLRKLEDAGYVPSPRPTRAGPRPPTSRSPRRGRRAFETYTAVTERPAEGSYMTMTAAVGARRGVDHAPALRRRRRARRRRRSTVGARRARRPARPQRRRQVDTARRWSAASAGPTPARSGCSAATRGAGRRGSGSASRRRRPGCRATLQGRRGRRLRRRPLPRPDAAGRAARAVRPRRPRAAADRRAVRRAEAAARGRARRSSGRPRLVLLDEPTTGLDVEAPPRPVGRAARVPRRRRDGAAHQPLPRGDRGARRARRRDRRGPGARGRHPRRRRSSRSGAPGRLPQLGCRRAAAPTLPGVSARQHRRRPRTASSPPTPTQLVRGARRATACRSADLEVRGASLEEAFLALTDRRQHPHGRSQLRTTDRTRRGRRHAPIDATRRRPLRPLARSRCCTRSTSSWRRSGSPSR